MGTSGQKLAYNLLPFRELPEAVQSFRRVRKLLNVSKDVGNWKQISLSAGIRFGCCIYACSPFYFSLFIRTLPCFKMILYSVVLCERLAQMLGGGSKRIGYSSRKHLSIISFKGYTRGGKRTFKCFYFILGGVISISARSCVYICLQLRNL